MREILFRGKRTDNGEWEYGDLWCNPDGKRVICIVSPINDQGTTGGNEVDPETIGQYIGLKDKNGKKIFEGDIVRDTETSEVGKIFFDKYTAMFVIGFENTVADFNASYNLEVIGNTYDNPELLLNEEMEDEKMSKLDLNSFGEIIDQFLIDNEVNMLLTLPAGTLDVQVQDNVGAGCVIQFYILLNSIKSICNAMVQQMGIDKTSPEWTKTVDTFLGMIKNEMVGEEV